MKQLKLSAILVLFFFGAWIISPYTLQRNLPLDLVCLILIAVSSGFQRQIDDGNGTNSKAPSGFRWGEIEDKAFRG